jgi:hypothetical protein
MRLLCAAVCLVGLVFGQTPRSTEPGAESVPRTKPHTSAKRDVGSGAADIGVGAAKGARSAVVGTGKSAVDLVTLHPVGAATDLGKGALDTGRNVGVGAAKGAGKILRGTGKAIRHLL